MIEHLRGREKALEPLGWIGDRRPASANRSGCRVRRAVPEMALRIEKAFDVSMDMLLRMQAW